MDIAGYRKDHSLTLEAFAALVGKSKGHMHEVEQSMRCAADLALAIEKVTDGAINASDLSDTVRLARETADRASAA